MRFKVGDKVMMVGFYDNDEMTEPDKITPPYKEWINERKIFTIRSIDAGETYPYGINETTDAFNERELKLAKIDNWKEVLQ